jgi:ATP-binding protein involved in chromosome partitioning
MTIRIAVPVAGELLCPHFGHCESFALFDVDPAAAAITAHHLATPPQHAPGVYPRWLAEQQVTLVLAGGMGGRARQMFAANGIEVVTGVEADDPATVVNAYLAGRLVAGENACNHGSHNCGDDHDGQ